MIRIGTADDLAQLVALEVASFDYDRLSARSLRNFLNHKHSVLLVDDEGGRVRGYALVLFHANTSLSRLYSIAVDPALRRRGVARGLMQEAMKAAIGEGATRMRLEVHQTNEPAQQFYRQLGFKPFALVPHYYEDDDDAIRMEAPLVKAGGEITHRPYYPQSLDFTCGPACLIMAMLTHRAETEAGFKLEIQLWREATTIFMTSGHGGCSALGLALAAWRRGFPVEVVTSSTTDMFVNTVRDPVKRGIIRFVEESFGEEAKAAGLVVHHRAFTLDRLRKRLDEGGLPIVLISSYRLTGDRAPHWVLVTAIDRHFVYINEPYIDVEVGKTRTDCIGIPLAPREFERMSRFGRAKHAAVVIVYPPKKGRA